MHMNIILGVEETSAQAHAFAGAMRRSRSVRLTGVPEAQVVVRDLPDTGAADVTVMGFDPWTPEAILVDAIAEWLSREVELIDRHHGAKGRKVALLGKIVAAYDVLPRMAEAWMEWGVTTLQMGLMTLEAQQIATILVSTLADGFTRAG